MPDARWLCRFALFASAYAWSWKRIVWVRVVQDKGIRALDAAKAAGLSAVFVFNVLVFVVLMGIIARWMSNAAARGGILEDLLAAMDMDFVVPMASLVPATALSLFVTYACLAVLPGYPGMLTDATRAALAAVAVPCVVGVVLHA